MYVVLSIVTGKKIIEDMHNKLIFLNGIIKVSD